MLKCLQLAQSKSKHLTVIGQLLNFSNLPKVGRYIETTISVLKQRVFWGVVVWVFCCWWWLVLVVVFGFGWFIVCLVGVFFNDKLRTSISSTKKTPQTIPLPWVKVECYLFLSSNKSNSSIILFIIYLKHKRNLILFKKQWPLAKNTKA